MIDPLPTLSALVPTGSTPVAAKPSANASATDFGQTLGAFLDAQAVAGDAAASGPGGRLVPVTGGVGQAILPTTITTDSSARGPASDAGRAPRPSFDSPTTGQDLLAPTTTRAAWRESAIVRSVGASPIALTPPLTARSSTAPIPAPAPSARAGVPDTPQPVTAEQDPPAAVADPAVPIPDVRKASVDGGGGTPIAPVASQSVLVRADPAAVAPSASARGSATDGEPVAAAFSDLPSIAGNIATPTATRLGWRETAIVSSVVTTSVGPLPTDAPLVPVPASTPAPFRSNPAVNESTAATAASGDQPESPGTVSGADASVGARRGAFTRAPIGLSPMASNGTTSPASATDTRRPLLVPHAAADDTVRAASPGSRNETTAPGSIAQTSVALMPALPPITPTTPPSIAVGPSTRPPAADAHASLGAFLDSQVAASDRPGAATAGHVRHDSAANGNAVPADADDHRADDTAAPQSVAPPVGQPPLPQPVEQAAPADDDTSRAEVAAASTRRAMRDEPTTTGVVATAPLVSPASTMPADTRTAQSDVPLVPTTVDASPPISAARVRSGDDPAAMVPGSGSPPTADVTTTVPLMAPIPAIPATGTAGLPDAPIDATRADAAQRVSGAGARAGAAQRVSGAGARAGAAPRPLPDFGGASLRRALAAAAPSPAPAATPSQIPTASDAAPAIARDAVRPRAPEAEPGAPQADTPAPASRAPDDAAQAAIVASATPQPAGRVFAAALATAWRDRAQRDRTPDDAAGIATFGSASSNPLSGHAVVQATGATGQGALDLTHDTGLQRMIEHIETLRDDADARDTRIRLVPDSLGGVDVAVRQKGDRVHVHFTAEQEATRAMLAEAQPRLTELAAARGVRIGDTSVSADAGGGNGAAPQPRAAPPATPAPAARITDIETPTPTDARVA